MERLYDVYLDAFDAAEAALQRRDDGLLQRLCAEASASNGLASAVTLLAFSDVGAGLEKRDRPGMLRVVLQSIDHRDS